MELELNKIYCMDCLEGLKLIPDNSIDLVLTDPPFNVNIDYEEHQDNMDDGEYGKWCAKWIQLLYDKMKVGGATIIFTGDKKIYPVQKAIHENTEFTFHHFLKWHKPNGQRALSGTVFFNRTELAFVLSKGKMNQDRINRKQLYSDTIIQHNTLPTDIDACDHPCRRPVALYSKIIRGFTNEGDTVLDPFMGSGTTAVACKQLQRNFIGFELSQKYVDIANRRLQQDTLFSYDVLEGVD